MTAIAEDASSRLNVVARALISEEIVMDQHNFGKVERNVGPKEKTDWRRTTIVSYSYGKLAAIVQSILHSSKTVTRSEAKEIRLQWLTKTSLLANLTSSGAAADNVALLNFLGFPSQ